VGHTGMTDVLAGIKAYLVTGGVFETEITAIETAKSITITSPQEIVFIESVSRQYPTIEFTPANGRASYADDQGAGAHGMDLHYVDMTAYHSSNDRSTVRDTLLYYDLALAMAIEADLTFGSRFNRVRRGEVDYSDLMQYAEAKTFLQIMRRRLEIRTTFEERS